jgi:hypothetical protein
LGKETLPRLEDDPAAWGTLLGWLFTHALGKAFAEEDFRERSRSWMDEWLLGKLLAAALRDLGLDETQAQQSVALVNILITHQGWFEGLGRPARTLRTGRPPTPAYGVLAHWLQDAEIRSYLQINRHREVLWFHKEAFEQLLDWMLATAAVEICAPPGRIARQVRLQAAACGRAIRRLRQAEQESGYQVEALVEAAKA